ncbi:hypothetical protein [Kineococcus rubinsiae]|uniref:hypothetical protein n=1 Tax=Kineococcus rubinsiae TaxID=2609562 RepID=UPI00142FF425|nr:hypothetical protein [Kineococcus rubinsiae]NIZ90494.1 hypothetical protein [Kineococcus rubinsiae]
MSTLDATPTPVRGAQTVAPVQASALEFAAAVLGEGGYVPERQLGAALTSTARVADAPVAQPAVRAGAPAEVVAEVPAEVVAEAPARPGFFARLWHRLTGR